MQDIGLERFGQLLESAIIGFGALWVAWAIFAAL